MMQGLEEAVARCEQVTAGLLELGETAEALPAIQEGLRERGALIVEIADFLSQKEGGSGVDAARLATLHTQGQELAHRLFSIRRQITGHMGSAAAQNAYSRCLRGMVPAGGFEKR